MPLTTTARQGDRVQVQVASDWSPGMFNLYTGVLLDDPQVYARRPERDGEVIYSVRLRTDRGAEVTKVARASNIRLHA